MRGIGIILVSSLISSSAFAQSNQQLVEYSRIVDAKYPKEMLTLKNENGEYLKVGNGLGYHFEVAKLDGKKDYLVVLYQAAVTANDLNCQLWIIDLAGKKQESSKAVILGKGEISNCDDIEFMDLDGDKKDEVLIDTYDRNSGAPQANPFIFKFDGKRLVDITPYNGKVRLFRSPKFTYVNLGINKMIIDSPATYYLHGEVIGRSDDQSFKSYAMQDGKIVLRGSYDYLQILNNDAKKKNEDFVILNPSFSADGTYTLEMKNLAPHKYAVRAEVIVNDSVVLKPQDFCANPPPPKSDKAKWASNEDDDDKNEDNMKRCTPKKEVYAIVNMKKTNTIKVKVYGPKSSVFQLSLVKKP